MYIISKEFHFSASHQLFNLAEEHPCMRVHGHNYLIKVELKNAVLNKDGFVVDYRELDIIKRWIDQNLDHRHLNDVLPFEQPSAENMAKYMFDVFKALVWQVSAIEVSETPKTNCRYEPDLNKK